MTEQAALIALYLFVLLYSVIIHEISHGVVALWLGDMTAKLAGRLTLNPVGHIDPIGSVILPLVMLASSGFRLAFGWAKPVPFNPYNLKYQKWGPAIVALAGPVTNFSLALIFALIARSLPIASSVKFDMIQLGLLRADWEVLASYASGSPLSILFIFCIMAIFWNVLLGVFNLIPIPPLDGSRLVFVIFDVSHVVQTKLERNGFFIIIAIFFMLPFLGLTLFADTFGAILQFGWGIFYTIAI